MPQVPARMLASGKGGLVEAGTLAHLAMGTFVSRDIEAARHRLEAFFGLECVMDGPNRLYARDRRAKYLMDKGERDFFVLEVNRIDEIDHPQALVNHWGFTVRNEQEVDRIRTFAEEHAGEFGLKRVFPATNMHGSYGFFVIDDDDNWFELEFRKGDTNDLMFSRGYYSDERSPSFPVVNPDLPIAGSHSVVLGDEVFMTHGTTAVADCDATRPFYEEVLGLRTVRHRRPANMLAAGGDFGVVGVGSGDRIQDQERYNRFILLFDTDEEVERRRELALEGFDLHRLRDVTAIEPTRFGGQSFLVKTADNIWFEVSSAPRSAIRKIFV